MSIVILERATTNTVVKAIVTVLVQVKMSYSQVTYPEINMIVS